MDTEHQHTLRRIYQADERLRADGRDSQSFHLMHRGGMRREIDHPRWDPSWAVPTEHTIDDLEELGMLRVEPHAGKNRTFALTLSGRTQGRALDDAVRFPLTVGGQAPASDEVLRWLVRKVAADPAALSSPAELIDRAVNDGVIGPPGREALARRILALIDEGYVRGDVPDIDQVGAEQTLKYAANLALTMKAHESVRSAAPASTTVSIYGPIVNSQVAGRDITNDTSFVGILQQAEFEIDALTGVDEETKRQAQGIVRTLLGKGAGTAGAVMTGAAGSLTAAVISRLLGLPLS